MSLLVLVFIFYIQLSDHLEFILMKKNPVLTFSLGLSFTNITY